MSERPPDATDHGPLNLSADERHVLTEGVENLLDAPWNQDDGERRKALLRVYAKLLPGEADGRDRYSTATEQGGGE